MHARTTTTALVLASTALLTACGTTSSTKPTHTATTAATTAAATPTFKLADVIAQCIDAINAGRDTGDGAPECSSLMPNDYADALRKANQAGRDKLQQQLKDAAKSTAP
jgi:predicted metalloprotease